MGEEQIKQNAWNDFGRYTPCDENEWIDGYVVGAYSRDNEIEELKKRIAELEDEVAQLANGENY